MSRANTNRLQILAVFVLLAAGYLNFFALKAKLEIELSLDTERPTVFRTYWASAGEPFTRDNSSAAPIGTNRTSYSLPLGNLANMQRIRIDPMEQAGKARIYSIRISQPGFQTLTLSGKDALNIISPIQQIKDTSYSNGSLIVEANGRDGQLQFAVENAQWTGVPVSHFINLFLLALISIIVHRTVTKFSPNLAFVPWLIAIALTLATIMAAITTFNVHPDENVHFGAVRYYSANNLPPSIDDPSIRETFSEFGKSRLSSYELFYPIAGYFTRLLDPLEVRDLLEVRLFTLTLLLILLLASIQITEFRVFLLPLLITPQVWYLFSYTNSDAFGLFMITILAYQVTVPGTWFNRFLQSRTLPRFWLQAVMIGVFCGSFLLLKPNYYFFLIFVFLFLVWRLGCGDFPDLRTLCARIGILVAIGLTVPAARFGLDVHANGWDTFEKYEQKIEQTAEHLYRPSTPLHKKHIALYLRERGISLDQLLGNMNWGPKLLINSFGSYGYTQYNPGPVHFTFIKAGCLMLFLTLLGSVVINGPPRLHVLMAIGSMCSLLLIGAILWLSWNTVFQPQGRYLAPMLTILGMVLYHSRDYLFKNVFYILIMAMFCLSVYSFVFTGLNYIAKISFGYG